jgi:hypothetical protein
MVKPSVVDWYQDGYVEQVHGLDGVSGGSLQLLRQMRKLVFNQILHRSLAEAKISVSIEHRILDTNAGKQLS